MCLVENGHTCVCGGGGEGGGAKLKVILCTCRALKRKCARRRVQYHNNVHVDIVSASVKSNFIDYT